MGTRGRPRSFDRSEALRRAMLLFWEQGYGSTSVADLAAAMGIHAPSLYAAFGSKERLFEEAVELYERLEGEPTRRALARPTARDAVHEMLSANADAYTDPSTPTGCMVVLGSAVTPRDGDRAAAVLAERRRADLTALRRRVDRSVEDGELPAGTDTEGLAAFFVAVLQGLAIQARDGASRQDLQPIIDHAMSVWDAAASA